MAKLSLKKFLAKTLSYIVLAQMSLTTAAQAQNNTANAPIPPKPAQAQPTPTAPAQSTTQAQPPAAPKPPAPANTLPPRPNRDDALAPHAEQRHDRNAYKSEFQGPFYIVDESPLQIIKIYENLTGKVAILSAQIPDIKINFTSPKMTREEAIEALKSILAVNGIAISPVGEKFFKVSPAFAMNAQAPEFIMGKASSIKPSQNFYSKLFKLEYIDIDTFKDSLNAFISPNGIATLTVFNRNNSFLLTDTLVNIQRIELVLEKLDRPTEISEDVNFITLKNVNAEDMKRRIVAMQSDLLKKYFYKSTIEADERTNQLIIIAPHGSGEIIKSFIEKLDIDSQPLTRSEVLYIKHGTAKDVAAVLNQIVKGQQAAVKATNQQKITQTNQINVNNRIANAMSRTNAARAGTNAAQRPTTLTPDLSGAALQFSEYVTIVADERSNSIVCYGTASDLKQIEDVVSRIDVVLAQVKVDVIITEVTLSDRQVSGLSSFGLNYSLTGSTTTTSSLAKGWSGNTTTWATDDSNSSPAFSASANEQGFSAVFNVARQNSGVKILSSPSIVTTHNKIATVNVSKRYPLLSSLTNYSSAVTPTTTSNVEWRDIGIILEVTPLIGENGVIQMEIKQTVESIIDYTKIDTSTQPIIGKREAKSFVSSKAGEMIVMAGLQQVNTNKTDGSVWLLGDIPGIGELFKPDKTVEERTELIIFIRPTLIKSSDYETTLKEQKLDKSASSKEIKNYIEEGKFKKGNIRNSVDENIFERVQNREYRPNVDYGNDTPKDEKSEETKGEEQTSDDQNKTSQNLKITVEDASSDVSKQRNPIKNSTGSKR